MPLQRALEHRLGGAYGNCTGGLSFRVSLQHGPGRCNNGSGSPFAGCDCIVVGKSYVIDVCRCIGNVINSAIAAQKRCRAIKSLFILDGAAGNIQHGTVLGNDIAARVQRNGACLRKLFGNPSPQIILKRRDIREGSACPQIDGDRFALQEAIT